MARLLNRLICAISLTALSTPTYAADLSDRHELRITADSILIDTRSDLGSWPDAGFGKLPENSATSIHGSTRIALEYRGQITESLFGHVIIDALDNTVAPTGITESYLEWRPLPSSPRRHRFRVGAFYPSISTENSDDAWESPYTRSYSAINAWLGEEIRPIGIDWRVSAPLGGHGSPRRIDGFAGLFYGNDTAGTLLFWRGWAIHNRQTRLNDRLPLAPLILPGPPGSPPIVIERELDPIAEIDDRPGIYAGGRWSLDERARLAVAFLDNRADAYAFDDGQWAWGTRFWHLAAEISLPGDLALVGQRMRGDTDWVEPPSRDGSILPTMAYVTDEFDSGFVLLSRNIRPRHRVSLRVERFDIWRPGEFQADHGRARTMSYVFDLSNRLRIDAEWIRIRSRRDLWPLFYGLDERAATETMLQIGIRLKLLDTAGR